MTREQILEAAAQIFSKKGYHATSMSDIASAVNLQKASLYHHVDSKQEILLSLLDEALELVTNRISAVISKPIPADAKLRLAMHTYLETLTEQRDLAAILLLEHRSLKPDLQARHTPRRDRFEQLWRDLIQGGIDEGKFKVLDVPLVTRALLGVMNWVVTWYCAEGPLSVSEIADQYTDLILNGFMVRE
ncbi:MAG: TetR/AcrR family transcriptional regulator [Anaerolineales bacterium]|nr:TetR/AcrR family transcriptional regulator [Anaerolineales bacterium]